ncbi:MAG TPA: hypothetical protein VEK33_12070 [Terriglobales bacterium]|nr:hypothetical protein [Terriglobales bacterium]
MKAIRYGMLAIVVAFGAASWAQSAQKKDIGSGKETLIGAWRLARIESTQVGWKHRSTERHADLHA